MMPSNNLIPRVYGGFRGVDFRGEEITLDRSPDALNMWKDYKETESIRTRPGTRLMFKFDDVVYGIQAQYSLRVACAKNRLSFPLIVRWAIFTGR